jgi:hypothetical protein
MKFVMIAILLIRFSSAETVTFTKTKIGTMPAGWSFAMTHSGGGPRWESSEMSQPR